jgi:hypothetical protein
MTAGEALKISAALLPAAQQVSAILHRSDDWFEREQTISRFSR